LSQDCLRMLVLELQPNEELCGVMRCRIRRDKESLARVDADEQSGVQPVLIDPKPVAVIPQLAAVLDLKTALVDWTVSGRRTGRKKRVCHYPHPLARGRLESDDK